MATYVLIPGAASDSSYWYLVTPELERRGHAVVAVDLPNEDDSAGLPEYADAVVDAIGDHTDLVLVAQSMGGFTAPLVCERVPVDLMVLVAAMVPTPGESGGQWWTNTGQGEAMREQAERDGRDPDVTDDETLYFHDVPAAVKAEVFASPQRGQSGTPFEAPFPLAAWPDVPTRFLLGRQDRLFPPDFQRRIVRERLGIVPDEMDSGHLPALAHPVELAARLDAYGREIA